MTENAVPENAVPENAVPENAVPENAVPGSTSARFAAGLEVRKQVLGADHVERSLAAVSDFARPVQELVTEYCWGEIWTREGLDRRTRSLLNLAMLTALNRGHEFAVHVRGAVANGVTESEIQEVLLQAAVYVGVPAALESFRIADRTLAELREQGAATS